MSVFTRTNFLREDLSNLKAAKETIKKEFLLYVNDQCIPLALRLKMWEENSASILPVGQWLSSCPEMLRDIFTTEYRGKTIMFQDLIENIIPSLEEGEEVPQELWDFGGSDSKLMLIIETKYPKVRAYFEAVFASAVAGFENDW